MTQRQEDAERSSPATPPVPPESNHPPPAASQTTPTAAPATAAPASAATDTATKPDALRTANRPRVGSETLAFHAAVAAGDVPAVEAYIAQNADKIRQCRAAPDALYRKEDTAGFAAMLVVPGPTNSDPDGGALSPLEVVDLRGRTPLHTACVEGQAEVVRVLLVAGADASAFDSAG